MTQEKGINPLVVFKQQMDKREGDFKAALPSHISPEHFMRVIMTAVQQNNRLLDADRRSFISAALRAAQDGLLPDGREGVLIPMGASVSWMPMTAGIRKKVRNSGEIATWDCNVICENDAFTFELGDEPFIHHRPILGNRGKLIGAYSVATLKNGEKSRDVMSAEEIYKVRDAHSEGWKQYKNGRTKSTPWSTDEGEMFKKTVARRHSKVLPMSTDLVGLFTREDEANAPQRTPVPNGEQHLSISDEALKGAGYPPQHQPSLSSAAVMRELESPSDYSDPDTGEISQHDTLAAFSDKVFDTNVKETHPSTKAGTTTVLVEEGNAIAIAGTAQLQVWMDGLGAPELARIKGYIDDMLAVARSSDLLNAPGSGSADGLKLSEEAKKRRS
jgi:recombination protein RecT